MTDHVDSNFDRKWYFQNSKFQLTSRTRVVQVQKLRNISSIKFYYLNYDNSQSKWVELNDGCWLRCRGYFSYLCNVVSPNGLVGVPWKSFICSLFKVVPVYWRFQCDPYNLIRFILNNNFSIWWFSWAFYCGRKKKNFPERKHFLSLLLETFRY